MGRHVGVQSLCANGGAATDMPHALPAGELQHKGKAVPRSSAVMCCVAEGIDAMRKAKGHGTWATFSRSKPCGLLEYDVYAKQIVEGLKVALLGGEDD